MRPRNFKGEGTVSDAGMWSTSSVVRRGSCRYSLMSFVYSSSTFCGCGAAAVAAGLPFFLCAEAGETERASAASAHTKRHCISDTNSAMSLWMSTWLSWTNELLAQGSDRFCARPRDPPPHGGATRVDRERAVERAPVLQSGA